MGTIIPNLLTAKRSIICIDPKGENAKIADRARQQFGPVHALDPSVLHGLASAPSLPSTRSILMESISPKTPAPLRRPRLRRTRGGRRGPLERGSQGAPILKIVAVESSGRRHLGTLANILPPPPNFRRRAQAHAGDGRSRRIDRQGGEPPPRQIRPRSRRRAIGRTK
ncbi:type IV secretory system conjugative DNA transfer family protein [Sinorhizobium meliloti]|uniref:type IV secretory system conjugative DNA transfer family protein n=1 Tax=Rhizobium meliloti TaxID=382 RepID=UPI0024687AF4|nr:type IV secretory system conjugative DNA transfer family protein [Sinorhizobium meliloti]